MPRGRNDYETAQIQGRLWTPAVLQLAAWFDASDISTISPGATVSQWNDISGNQNHATQATASLQPSLAVSSGGRPFSLYFSGGIGSEQRLALTSALSYTSSNPAFSVFGAQRQRATRLLAFGGAAKAFFGDSGSSVLFRDNNDVGITASSSSLGSWHVTSGVRKGTGANQSDVWVNGLNIGTGTLGATFGADFIGARFLTASYQASDGWIGEAIAVSSALSARDRQLVEGYLGWKWGVTLVGDHPYANRPPLIGD